MGRSPRRRDRGRRTQLHRRGHDRVRRGREAPRVRSVDRGGRRCCATPAAPSIARRLAEANLETSVGHGWNASAARCERALARCDLADGAADDAEPRLRRAVATFRDGDIRRRARGDARRPRRAAPPRRRPRRGAARVRGGDRDRRSRATSCRRSPSRSRRGRASAPTWAPSTTPCVRATTPTTRCDSRRGPPAPVAGARRARRPRAHRSRHRCQRRLGRARDRPARDAHPRRPRPRSARHGRGHRRRASRSGGRRRARVSARSQRASSFSTYFATTSTSRFTRAPGGRARRASCARASRG